jgi:hypothetical protein
MDPMVGVEKEIEEAIHQLPAGAHTELWQFIKYLQFKYGIDKADEIVQLGGLWADIVFDVSDEDVRALRQKITSQLLDRI